MTTIRLMTLNLRMSGADDGPNNWAYRWPHLRALIAELKPDVIGAQECMPNQLVAILGELPGFFGYLGPDTMIPGEMSPRNPVFVCESCGLPRHDGALALNETGVIGQVGWDGWMPRLAQILYFDGWMLVNTHFEAREAPQARLESARLLAAFIGDRAAVIMGDLNCPPDSPPVEHMRAAGFALAKDQLPPEVDRRTFHKFTGQGIVEMDYILTRGLTVQQVMIPRPRTEPPFLSDHDPVVVDVVLP